LTAAQVSQETREALWEEFDQAQREDWLVARADFSRECKSVFHAIVLNGSDTPPADKRNANDSIDKMLDRVDKMIDSVDKMLAAAEHLIETADACHDVYMSLYSAAPAPAPYRPPARRRSRLPYADDDDDEHDIFDN
jgi:hypothetical protein